MKKLAIISTHPIQYYAPVFKLLQERNQIAIKVFYTWGKINSKKHDPGFDRLVEWDLPLLEGYAYEWMTNTSSRPGSHHFTGIKNPVLIEQITNFKPDALLVFGWCYQSHLLAMRHFKGKFPVYFRGDSTLHDEIFGLKAIIKKGLLKWVYKYVDRAFYVGNSNKQYFLNYGINEARLSFTPHAVDNARFAEDRLREAQDLRNKLGLQKNDILVLFAGKFEPKKAPLLLLEAFQELTVSNIHLLFAGNGVLEGKLKAAASNALSMSARIHFMDFQNQTQMPVLYQACDLFCLPSKGPGESWGLAINEAMACGKAILASDKVGCANDLVINYKNGLIFKSGNLIDLKEKLEHLVTSKIRLNEYGTQSKKIIQTWNFYEIASTIEKTLLNEYKTSW